MDQLVVVYEQEIWGHNTDNQYLNTDINFATDLHVKCYTRGVLLCLQVAVAQLVKLTVWGRWHYLTWHQWRVMDLTGAVAS